LQVYLGKKKYATKLKLTTVLHSISGLGTSHINGFLESLSLKSSTRIESVNTSFVHVLSILIRRLSTLNDLNFRYKILRFHRIMGTYRGIRMRQGLPRHGQRTRSNRKMARLMAVKSKNLF